MNFFEMSDNGQMLEWKEHALSGVMSLRGKPLLLEPALLDRSERERLCLAARTDEKKRRVEWSWETKWRSVQVRAYGANLTKPIIRKNPEPPWIEWKEVAVCHYVEITPYDSKGQPGVTERKKRPTNAYDHLIRMRPNRKKDKVDIELPRSFKPGEFFALCYVFNGNRLERWTELVPFERHFLSAPVVNRDGYLLVGYVCVIHQRNGERFLVACRGYDDPRLDSELPSADEGHIQKLRADIETRKSVVEETGINGWLALWPSRSQQLLRLLYEEATRSLRVSPSDAFESLRLRPKGLCRALVILHSDYRKPDDINHLINQLDSMTSNQMLQMLISPVPQDFARLPPNEMDWILKHRAESDLNEVIDWARTRGVDALSRALKLTVVRSSARQAEKDLQTDADEHKHAVILLGRIEAAPGNDDSIDSLRDDVRKLTDKIALDKRQVIDPDQPPPITREQHEKWRKAREEVRVWRLELDRVLTFCETGRLASSLAKEVPQEDELEKRLTRILAPAFEPNSKENPEITREAGKAVDELLNNRLIHDLLGDGRHKRRSDFYALALKQLTLVSSRVCWWWPLHEDLREAERQADKYHLWAQEAGVFNRSADLNERIRAAHDFLAMIKEFNDVAASWPVPMLVVAEDRLARDPEEWREILLQPNHPRIAPAYALYVNLRKILGPESQVEGEELLKRMPMPPARSSLQLMGLWWRKLQLLDKALEGLGREKRDLANSTGQIYERYRSRIRVLLKQYRGRNNKPSYYSDLERLYSQCEREGANMTKIAIKTLLRFIGETAGLEERLSQVSEPSGEENRHESNG